MATVVANMSMSLDGFVADASGGVERLFGWYSGGPATVRTADPRWTFQTDEASAADLRDLFAGVGALVCGRRLFDLTGGWDGSHPTGAPVFVVTHTVPDGWPREGVPVEFFTDGIERAVSRAKAAAGEKVVAVASANVARQCLDAGLLDEIRVDLVPVLLGDGIPFFANLAGAPVELEGPRVTEGAGVTHLHYRVKPTTGRSRV